MLTFLLLSSNDSQFDYATSLFDSLLTIGDGNPDVVSRDLSHLLNVLPHIRQEDPNSVICMF